MKSLLSVIILIVVTATSAFSLEPLNVAIVNTNAGPHNLVVEINDYTTPPANFVYSENFNGLTPNSSGVITFTLGVSSLAWGGIPASDVNSHYVLDIKIGGNLYAQYRLDELIQLQAQTGVTDKDGNIIPGNDDASTLGSDDQRWKDVYVGPSSLHIGESGDEGAISFDTGTNTLELNAENTEIMGHTTHSIDNSSQTLNNNDNIVIGNNTIIRLKSNSGNNISGIVLPNGTYDGQIIYLTNENGGEIDLDNTNIIGNAKIIQRSAAQFIWGISKWIMLNRQ